jgi:hypothetical protein
MLIVALQDLICTVMLSPIPRSYHNNIPSWAFGHFNSLAFQAYFLCPKIIGSLEAL